MTDTTVAAKDDGLVEKLDAELTAMANAQFETPEFVHMFSVPLTMERARFLALQFVLYNVNRRDCWGYVQGRAPWDVKRAIWQHEKDELFYDPHGGSDHRVLMAKEAYALGASEDEVANVKPTPLLEAANYGFIHLAMTLPWLAALTASHFLERRNNNDKMVGGGLSSRWRDHLAEELPIDPKILISSNVHVIAEVAHSDDIWDAIAGHVVDEESYQDVLHGARACCVLDRAYRGALAHGMEAV